MVLLRSKFKLCARLVVLSIRLCKQSVRNFARSRHQYESVLQAVDECGTEISWDGHSFYPGYYCTKKPHILNSSARRILKQDPQTRLAEDIQILLVALKNIPALNEYPRNMQQKLCQLGRYETLSSSQSHLLDFLFHRPLWSFVLFEPWRILVHEGDLAYCFYFILSGSVVVTSFDQMTGSSRTLVTLTEGMSFGDLAFAANSRRQATVCSKTQVELLSITGEEFEELFMDGKRDVLADDQNNEFIRGLNFLRHWPVERLKGNRQVSTVYYFDRNQVLVRDSNNSDWIYVVLKGSLSVLKKLPRHEPQPSMSRPKFTSRSGHGCLYEVDWGGSVVKKKRRDEKKYRRRRDNLNLSLNDKHDIKGEHVKVRQKTLNDTEILDQEESFKTQFEVEMKLNQTLPGYYNINDRLKSLDYDKIITSFQSKLVTKGPVDETRSSYQEFTRPSLQLRLAQFNSDQMKLSVNKPLDDHPGSHDINRHFTPLPDIRDTNTTVKHGNSIGGNDGSTNAGNSRDAYDVSTDAERAARSAHNVMCEPKQNKEKRQRIRKLGISHTLKGAYLAPSRSQIQPPINGRNSDGQCQEDQASPPSQTGSLRNQIKPESLRQKLARLQMEYQRRLTDREGRRTIAEDLDHKARHDYVISEIDLDPMFIEVEVLERGQYFGIAPILFHDKTSLSLVSNGAECLVISKKHFLAWADDKCLRYLRLTESSYPGDLELSRKLQEVINWRAHRAGIYQILEHQIRERQTKRKQFLPAFIGQYCFRSGPI